MTTPDEWARIRAAFATPAEDEEAVYPGTLLGYRYWRTDNRVLRSVIWDVPWDRPTVTAVCRDEYGLLLDDEQAPLHSAPWQECCCGFYGWYTSEEALSNHVSNWGLGDPEHRSDALIFGTIAASGKVIPGTIGFRAEKAQILGVVGQGMAWASVATDFEARYPDVAVAESIEDLIRRFPPQDVPWSNGER